MLHHHHCSGYHLSISNNGGLTRNDANSPTGLAAREVALKFTNPDVFVESENANIGTAEGITMCAWVLPASVSDPLAISNVVGVGSSDSLSVGIFYQNGNFVPFVQTISNLRREISTNQWHFIAITNHPDDAGFYVDTTKDVLPSFSVDGSNRLFVGGSPDRFSFDG